MLHEQLIPDLRDAPDELLLTRPEMAAVMNTTTDRLEHMEAEGQGPPVIRLGPRAPRYQLGRLSPLAVVSSKSRKPQPRQQSAHNQTRRTHLMTDDTNIEETAPASTGGPTSDRTDRATTHAKAAKSAAAAGATAAGSGA